MRSAVFRSLGYGFHQNEIQDGANWPAQSLLSQISAKKKGNEKEIKRITIAGWRTRVGKVDKTYIGARGAAADNHRTVLWRSLFCSVLAIRQLFIKSNGKDRSHPWKSVIPLAVQGKVREGRSLFRVKLGTNRNRPLLRRHSLLHSSFWSGTTTSNLNCISICFRAALNGGGGGALSVQCHRN